MSRWTTLPLILTLSLILLSLSAEVAAAADDLPRNIELKVGATLPDDTTAADTSITEEKTRQIVTEPAAGKDPIPTDAAGKPDTPKEGEGASVAAPAPAPVVPAPDDKATPDAAPAGGKAPEAAAIAAPPPGPSGRDRASRACACDANGTQAGRLRSRRYRWRVGRAVTRGARGVRPFRQGRCR